MGNGSWYQWLQDTAVADTSLKNNIQFILLYSKIHEPKSQIIKNKKVNLALKKKVKTMFFYLHKPN